MLIEALPDATYKPPEVKKAALRLVEHLKLRPADLHWTISMLSSFKEQANIQCPIFDLDYVAPPRHSKQTPVDETLTNELVKDTDGFFSKLPPLSLTVMKKTKMRTLLTPKERQMQQLAKEKARLEVMQAKIR